MIEVADLVKRFGPKTAVDGVSFKVNKGEVLGFLGPNGAGKSTTMRMITGYLPPTAGAASIGGVDVVKHPIEAKLKVGYLPENAPLYSDMTVSEFLNFCASLRGVPKADRPAAVKRALDMCFLESVRNQSTDTLSKGFRHRTCFAQSVVHDPEVLVLDEPTDGLDPNQKSEVRNLIRRMGEDKAIIFSTHILEEVDAACSRAIIIDQGRVVADGTPEQLRSRADDAGSVKLVISGMAGSGIRQELEKLGGIKTVDEIKASDTMLIAQAHSSNGDGREATEQVFNLAKDRGWVIHEMRIEEGRLEDVFAKITVSETGASRAKAAKAAKVAEDAKDAEAA